MQRCECVILTDEELEQALSNLCGIVFMKFKLEEYPGDGDIITKKFSIADVMPVIDYT